MSIKEKIEDCESLVNVLSEYVCRDNVELLDIVKERFMHSFWSGAKRAIKSYEVKESLGAGYTLELKEVLGDCYLDKISKVYFGRPLSLNGVENLSEDKRKVFSHIQYDVYNKGVSFIEDVVKEMEIRVLQEVK